MAGGDKNIVGVNQEILVNVKSTTEARGEDLGVIRDINDELRNQLSLLKGNLDFKVSTRRILKGMNKITEESVDFASEDVNLSLKSEKVEKRLLNLKKQQKSLQRESLFVENEIFLKNQQGNKEEEEALISLQKLLGATGENADKFQKSLEETLKITKQLEGKFGVNFFSGIEDISKAIPGLRKFSGPFEKAAEASREVASSAFSIQKLFDEDVKEYARIVDEEKKLKKGDTASKKFAKDSGRTINELTSGKLFKDPLKGINFRAAGAGFKSLGGIITKALGPISLAISAIKGMQSIFDTMLGASSSVAKFRQDFTMTNDQATSLREKTYDLAFQTTLINKESGGIAISQKMIEKTLYSINEQLGTQLNLIQDYGDESAINVAFASILLDKLKLSGKATTKLFNEATNLNIPLEEHTKQLLGGITYLGHQNNLMFDQNKILEETAGISGEMRAHFGNNSKEIAKMVYQSKLLGFNLENVKSISKGLLDFESSLEAEMEARMLTNLDLNLEGARYYALIGDTAGVMREITAQGITQEKYAEMNVISRESIAKALNMSSDELADQLIKEKENQKLAKQRELTLYNIGKRGIQFKKEDFDFEKDSYEVLIAKAKAQGLSLEETYDILGKNLLLQKQSESAQDKFNKVLDQAREIFASLINGGTLDSLAAGLEGLANSALLKRYRDKSDSKSAQELIHKDIESDGNLTKEEKKTKKEEVDEQYESAINKKGGLQRTGDYLGGIIASTALGLGKVVTLGLNDTINSGFGNAIKSMKDTYKDQEAFDNLMIKKKKLDNEKDPTTENPIKVEDFISRPGQPPISFRKDDLIIGGTQLTSKEKGPLSNNSSDNSRSQETNVLLKRLISIVEQGGNVNLDGNKVGNILAMNASQLG